MKPLAIPMNFEMTEEERQQLEGLVGRLEVIMREFTAEQGRFACISLLAGVMCCESEESGWETYAGDMRALLLWLAGENQRQAGSGDGGFVALRAGLN